MIPSRFDYHAPATLAALRAQGETRIVHADAAAISYPQFFSTLDRLAER